MTDGGIQHSGSRPSASNTLKCRESVLSVLACRLRPRAAAVSAGSPACAAIPGGGRLPAPGAPLHGERDVAAAGEPRQPGPQVHPVSRGDLATPHLPAHRVEIV